jgi:aryl-alcohol dehydrogenase-like predicted oxidoreductase
MNSQNSSVFRIGGDLVVNRVGFGAMRLTGRGVWGPPEDPKIAQAVLRRAVELGVNFIDTADVYGPGYNERLIRDALSPYGPELIIGTKGGVVRSGPATRENPGMSTNGTQAHIRRAVEGSLRDLGVDCIDLYQLHRVDPNTPIEETMHVLHSLRAEGKIRYVGLSEVTVEQIQRAQSVIDIATVQNGYNIAVRTHEDVLVYCERNNIGFIPFWPLHGGALPGTQVLAKIAGRMGATPAQISLAWLLQKSPAIILIPGTSSVRHLEENLAVRDIVLSEADMKELDVIEMPLH